MCFIIRSAKDPNEIFMGTILGEKFSLEKSKGRDVSWVSGASSTNTGISQKITWSGRVERLKMGIHDEKLKITPLWVNPDDDEDNKTAWRELKRLGLKHEYPLPQDHEEFTKRQILRRVLTKQDWLWQDVDKEWR